MTEETGDASILGRVVALELILRALVTSWALKEPDPRSFSRRMIDGIVSSMRSAAGAPKSGYEEEVLSAAEKALHDLRDQVDVRLQRRGF